MSKRSKFVMVTWVGSNVSVMKKAKMSTDKALVKDIIQVEIQILIVKAYSQTSPNSLKVQLDIWATATCHNTLDG